MKMKKKRRSGTSLAALIALFLPAAAVAEKKKAVPQAYALVSGTVFQESGFSLPNANVALIPDPPAEGPPVKVKRMQAVSDSRGEFVFRVPPVAMRYTVKVTAPGFASQQKTINIQGEERGEVTFQLQRESK